MSGAHGALYLAGEVCSRTRTLITHMSSDAAMCAHAWLRELRACHSHWRRVQADQAQARSAALQAIKRSKPTTVLHTNATCPVIKGSVAREGTPSRSSVRTAAYQKVRTHCAGTGAQPVTQCTRRCDSEQSQQTHIGGKEAGGGGGGAGLHGRARQESGTDGVICDGIRVTACTTPSPL